MICVLFFMYISMSLGMLDIVKTRFENDIIVYYYYQNEIQGCDRDDGH